MPGMRIQLSQAEEPESDLAGLLKKDEPDMDDDSKEQQMRAAVQAIESQIQLLTQEKHRMLQELGDVPSEEARGTVAPEEGV